MGKKKEKKTKIKKHTPQIEERLKSIQNIQIPDQNPDKMDNDNEISRFFRFGLKRGGLRLAPRDQTRLNKKSNRPKKSSKF